MIDIYIYPTCIQINNKLLFIYVWYTTNLCAHKTFINILNNFNKYKYYISTMLNNILKENKFKSN